MNVKRFVRKNWIVILLIVIVGVITYNYMYEEGFQNSTIRVGGSCIGTTSQPGTCPSGSTKNTSAGNCERTVYYCSDSGTFQLNGRTCENRTNRSITRPALSRIERKDYICPTGTIKKGNLTCFRTGTYICPSGSVRINNGKCIICPPNTTYETGSIAACVGFKNGNPADKIKINGQVIDPTCSV
jgi:hypothetical protein